MGNRSPHLGDGLLVRGYIRQRPHGQESGTASGSSLRTMALNVYWSSSRWGKIQSSPFPPAEVAEFKQQVIDTAARSGYQIVRRAGDRTDVPIDYRFRNLLLRVAEDPEVGLGEYAQGVRVGPGTRMPRLPALFKPKKKWRLPSQADPLDYLEHAPDRSGVWRRNYSTLQEFESQVWK